MNRYEWVGASPNKATCAEVMDDGFMMNVRNSTDPTGTVLKFTYEEWRAFTAGVMNGEFDPKEEDR